MGDPPGKSSCCTPFHLFLRVSTVTPSLLLHFLASCPTKQLAPSYSVALTLKPARTPRGPARDVRRARRGPGGQELSEKPRDGSENRQSDAEKGPQGRERHWAQRGARRGLSVHMLWAAWLQPDPKLLTFEP
ncbi:hypothetical protein Adt_49388 [Abeliophyllum distichum]|uniref:Uncharacterized protein n=1 Tax=Abeliophyllum distichum TaxID=126358 RepID=A0ABD1NNZ0_9LAMI